MALIICAGFPSCGKTSVIKHLAQKLNTDSLSIGYICCSNIEQKKIFSDNISEKYWITENLCPDHFLAANLNEIINWKNTNNSEILVIESAGLCSRCSPFPEKSLAIFVIDFTFGLGLSQKIGPMLTTCDICICTKVDRLSRTEQILFVSKLKDVNKNCKIILLNGLTGEGINDLMNEVDLHLGENTDDQSEIIFRTALPQFFCAYCMGKSRVKIGTI